METRHILRQIIEQTGMYPNEMAEHTGVPIRNIENWVYMGVEPSAKKFMLLIKKMGYKIEITRELEDVPEQQNTTKQSIRVT
jgi:hypothetical protein